MDCSNCGQIINETLHYCPKCGCELPTDKKVELDEVNSLIADIINGEYGAYTIRDSSRCLDIVATKFNEINAMINRAKTILANASAMPEEIKAKMFALETAPLMHKIANYKLLLMLLEKGILDDLTKCNKNSSADERIAFAKSLRQRYMTGEFPADKVAYGLNCFLAPMLNIRIDSWDVESLGNLSGKITGRVSGLENLEYCLGDKIQLEFIKCPSGEFFMGTPDRPTWKQEDQVLHKVVITKDFYMAKFPVTQILFKALMGYNPSHFYGENNPVESVTWFQAKEFCKKLNDLTYNLRPLGFEFDLPTETQWEYACRCITNIAQSEAINKKLMEGKAVYEGQVGWSAEVSFDTTHPVGTAALTEYSESGRNAWGIFDMLGNVQEWCLDWYGPYPKDGVDPKGPEIGKFKVLRGGSFDYYSVACMPTSRSYDEPDHRIWSAGFRVALVRK